MTLDRNRTKLGCMIECVGVATMLVFIYWFATRIARPPNVYAPPPNQANLLRGLCTDKSFRPSGR